LKYLVGIEKGGVDDLDEIELRMLKESMEENE
jgi:hypothetical protein